MNENIYLKIIKWGIYLILFVPLIVSTNYIFPFVVPKTVVFRILVEIIFVAYLLLALVYPKYRPRFNALSWAVIIFIGIMALTSLTGLNFGRSFWSTFERMTGLLTFLHLGAFFIVCIAVFKTKEEWFRLFRLSIIAAILVSFYALGQKLGWTFLLESGAGRPGGTIGNPTFLATYLLFNVFFSLMFGLKELKEKNKTWSIFYFLAFVFLSAILFLTATRGAILAWLGGLLILGFFSLKSLTSQKTKKITVVLIILLIISTSLLFTYRDKPWVKDNSCLNRLLNISLEDTTIKSRFVVWQSAWQAWQERFFLGWGPENFNLAFNKYFNPLLFSPEYGDRQWFDRAHNIIFDLGTTSGLIGCLSYLSLFLIALSYLWGHYCRGQEALLTLFTAVIVLIVYFLQNLFVFDMISSYLLFFLVLGFVVFLRNLNQKPVKITPANQYSAGHFRPGLAILLIVLMFFVMLKTNLQPVRAAHYLYRAQERYKYSYEQILSFYQQAIKMSPLGRGEARESLANFMMSLKPDQTQYLDKAKLKEGFELAIKEMKNGVAENPDDFRFYLNLARLYNRAFESNPNYALEAEKVLIQGFELSPRNQQVYWELAQVKLFQQKINEAIALMQAAIDLNPEVAAAHHYLGLVYKITNQPEKAIEELEKTLELGLGQPSIYLAIAEMRLQLGQAEQTIPIYQKVISLIGDRPQLHLKLAQTYLALADGERAKEELEKVIRFNQVYPDQAALEQAQALLEEL